MRDGVREKARTRAIGVDYERGCDVLSSDTSHVQRAADLAAVADVAIVVVGDAIDQTGETKDRYDLDLGEANPSGKLTISFPSAIGQQPVYYQQNPGWHGSRNTGYTSKPLFAFGYGLERGQSEVVRFELGPDDLTFIGRDNRPITEPGEFEVMVGSSSRDENLLKARFTLLG